MARRRRTCARELALQHLVAQDLRRDEELDPDPFLRTATDDDEVYLFALGLVHGCRRHLDEIDREIQATSTNWDLRRMATVDRNVLRLGTYELLYRPDIPPQVTINEAVELAKRYSTEKSAAFVNGVLDRIRARHGLEPTRRGRRPADAAPEPSGTFDESARPDTDEVFSPEE